MSALRRSDFHGFRNVIVRSGEFSRTIRLGLPLRGAAERLAAENPALTRLLTLKNLNIDFSSEGRRYTDNISHRNTGTEGERLESDLSDYFSDPANQSVKWGGRFISNNPLDPYRERQGEPKSSLEMISELLAQTGPAKADAERAKRMDEIDRLIAGFLAKAAADRARRSTKAAETLADYIFEIKFPPKEKFTNIFPDKPQDFDISNNMNTEPQINPWTGRPYTVDPGTSDFWI